MKRIMYIEEKYGLDGPGRIGWVELSRSKRSYRYAGRVLLKVGDGYKYNCVDAETGQHYWVSGPKRNGEDKLYGGVVEIDEDARQAYWRDIRGLAGSATLDRYRAPRPR
jgi:hypothetical protein